MTGVPAAGRHSKPPDFGTEVGTVSGWPGRFLFSGQGLGLTR